MMKKLLSVIVLFLSINTYSQICDGIHNKVDANYSYVSTTDGFELPFNISWEIIKENQGPIMVLLANGINEASAGIIKGKNSYHVNSVYDVSNDIVIKLVNSMGFDHQNLVINNVKLKNIKAKEIKFNSDIDNLEDSYSMKNLIYMIVKDGYTYLFAFKSPIHTFNCYEPFFKNVMKSSYFDSTWY